MFNYDQIDVGHIGVDFGYRGGRLVSALGYVRRHLLGSIFRPDLLVECALWNSVYI